MSKLMLVSAFAPVSHLLGRIEPNLKGRTVAFIPTASMKDSTGFFNRMAKWKLRALGLNVQEIDVAVAPYLDSNYAGLGLVDFSIVPHIDSPALGESAAEIMRHSNSDDHMVPIRDDQAVLVNGPHVELVER